MEQKPVKS